MTPYRDGDAITVTSTLAFMRKTEAVRRDGRVALLAGGWLVQGDARVHADVSGDEFVARFLDAELRKYPPARDIVAIPLHRRLFDWYFGRVFMTVTPVRVTAAPGADQATLITLAADGFPVIAPIAPPPDGATSVPVRAADGPATVLLHAEDAEMRDLRQVHLHGRIAGGVFTVESRRGSLAPARLVGAAHAAARVPPPRPRRPAPHRGVEVTPDRHRCATQLSFWLPGLGQLYLHRWWRGAVMLAASWITFDQAWRACSAVWTVATVAVWIIAVRDASV